MLMLAALPLQAQQSPKFIKYFKDATLRVDYLRVGNKQHDTCKLQRFVMQSDNVWAGSTTQLLDPIDNGAYRLMVKDAKSGMELYSRCYNTLFEEYRETAAGKDSIATFEEVMLMPMPKQPVDICLQKRGDNGKFATATTFRFDPKQTQTSVITTEIPQRKLLYNGDWHNKIDVVIVAEGYGKSDAEKMQGDFEKFASYLVAQEPFASRKSDFNVWGVGVLMQESGVTDPNRGKYVKSAVGSSYNTFGSDRYLMTTKLFQLHDLLAGVPYDHIIIMANCDTYGGGAIYNFYAFSAVQAMSMWILPHELGHSIGGLADEYVDDELSYNDIHNNGREPVEPNITTLVDFGSKWQSMVPEGTPIPTKPVEGLGKRDNGPMGAYEGAGYQAKGVYRPCTKCMMRDYAAFCPVCKKRLNEVFNLYVK